LCTRCSTAPHASIDALRGGTVRENGIELPGRLFVVACSFKSDPSAAKDSQPVENSGT
jgi:hypothetical protein